MPTWKIKSSVHRLLAGLPRPEFWNLLLQTYVTRSIQPTAERTLNKVRRCGEHIDNYRRASRGPREGFTAFELGTGWSPVVPICLALSGAGEVWTLDIAPMLEGARVRETFRILLRLAKSGALHEHLPVRGERLELMGRLAESRSLRTPQELLNPLGVRTLVEDARSLRLPDGSCDLICSDFVFGHITEDVLLAILKQFRRILRPGGVMSHHIDLSDLYAYFDPSLTPFSCLQYTDEMWAKVDSPLAPQSRLRAGDYRRLMAESEFDVVEEKNTSGQLEDLRRVSLAPRFQSYSEDDLLVVESWIVARGAA